MRGVSFGTEAARYDATRPGYPPVFVDRLMADNPRDVLDVGCGTGLAARLFVERGCNVLGVEPDPRMADFARETGVAVETSKFEDWDTRERTFDLVVCAQAWWWLDRDVAMAKIIHVLPSGKRLGILWNAGAGDDEVTKALADAYNRMGGVREPMLPGGFSPPVQADLEADDRLRDVEFARCEWERRYSRDEWIIAAGTFSDVIALEPERRDRLFEGIRFILDENGGFRDVKIASSLVNATRA